ncbi:MAG: ImmA/IrrE family metallo-endopeptidase [Egibacteraceae bacterium]
MSRLLARGFKSGAERLAGQTRAELGLGPFDRLDPGLLASHLCIPVVGLGDLDWSRDDHGGADLDRLAAVTVALDEGAVVVVNDSHPTTRQVSSLSHELAHLLLEHPPRPVLGARRWEPELEAKADWLGAALLVPEEAARVCAIGGASDAEVARRFAVSPALARWRLDATGARRVAAHVRAKRARTARTGTQ